VSRVFVVAHRKCAGRSRCEPAHSLWLQSVLRVKRGCGQDFTRWVTPDDADEDLLRSAPLAFEN
jgi:hypothetical protein